MKTAYEEFGFELNNGWQEIALKATKELVALGFKIDQVKEKFGGLRIYYSEPYPEACSHEAFDKADKIVTAAENECSRTCEFCGEPGIPRDTRWIRTLCETHYQEQLKNQLNLRR